MKFVCCHQGYFSTRRAEIAWFQSCVRANVSLSHKAPVETPPPPASLAPISSLPNTTLQAPCAGMKRIYPPSVEAHNFWKSLQLCDGVGKTLWSDQILWKQGKRLVFIVMGHRAPTSSRCVNILLGTILLIAAIKL